MKSVLQDGRFALQSFGWYLDQQVPSTNNPPTTHYEWIDTWQDFYTLEPTSGLNLPPATLQLILGGEACMWGEQVDDATILPRVWPRASATAERLWSAQTVTSVSDATKRLDEFRCKVLWRRGITASPLIPGYCDNSTYFHY